MRFSNFIHFLLAFLLASPVLKVLEHGVQLVVGVALQVAAGAGKGAQTQQGGSGKGAGAGCAAAARHRVTAVFLPAPHRRRRQGRVALIQHASFHLAFTPGSGKFPTPGPGWLAHRYMEM